MRAAVILCPCLLLLDDELLAHLAVLQYLFSTEDVEEQDVSQGAKCLLDDLCFKMEEHKYEVTKIRS